MILEEKRENMQSKMKGFRKWICLGLVFGMIAASVPVWHLPMQIRAAEPVAEVTLDSVRAEAAASYAGIKKGFDLAFDPRVVTEGKDYSAQGNYLQVFNNLKNSPDDQTIIIRFKTSQQDGFLFGAGTNTNGNGQNMIFALKGGGLRAILRNADQADGKKGTFGSGLADGKWHTFAMSFVPSKGTVSGNARLALDGGSDIYPAAWTFKCGFNQGASPYTKFEIGGGAYAYADACNSKDFIGELDFVTVINKAYTPEQLAKITERDKNYTNFSEMFVSGTCPTWLFTGGTEGVADFARNRTTRNWVGLFESSFRDSGTFVERGRFVFNTSKRGADVAQILAEYDTRVKPFGTKAVGILIGAADYRKGQAGIGTFKEKLGTFIEKLKSDGKFPLILTPYPSPDAAAEADAALYRTAIAEVAGGMVKVVDLSGVASANINSDGSLKPAGHQEIANKIKDAVGNSSKTGFNFAMLSDGSYTVAKKTAQGGEAEADSVTASDRSITVRVAPGSLSNPRARLAYTLTDEDGQEISGETSSGEAEFTADGLRRGETYTLRVYDMGRQTVREAYRPVRICTGAGNTGESLEHGGNISSNEQIRSLVAQNAPATWLFMGDSITHGVVTEGYDNVPQMFAKYLDELGRTDDIVLNTGVSNATIATTINQIEPRLKRYKPDVVMIMLGTNDTSVNGQNTVTGIAQASTGKITVEDYISRYKILVRKVYETNPDASVVLRVPCEMVSQLEAHSGYADYFQGIYTVAEDMRTEISGANITVVNHLQEWRRYRDNVRNDSLTGSTANKWLVGDGIHPNGRGNLSMFQQIIKELGIYESTSEIANYQYSLSGWTGSSAITAAVTQRSGRASVPMSALSGYASGLKTVTLTLSADGKSFSKTQPYAANGTVSLRGLDASKTYTAKVTGKDAADSKEITFAASITKSTDTTATDEERQEFTESLDAAIAELDGYPSEILEAFRQSVRSADAAKPDLTLEQLDAMLESIDAAKQSAKNAKQEYDAEKSKLAQAVAQSQAAYMANQAAYGSLASWSEYNSIYNSARAVDTDTPKADLIRLYNELKSYEAKLDEEKAAADSEIKPNPDPNTPQDPGKNPNTPQDPQGTPNVPGTPNTPGQTVQLQEGTVYYAGDYGYRIVSLAGQTAELAAVKNEGLTKLTAEASVVLEDGKTYQVTSIAAGLFKNYKNKKNVTDIVIHTEIEKIEKQAFAGFAKLKSVSINSKKLTEIGDKAFFGLKKLKSIAIASEMLKKAGKNTFKGTAKNLVILVPKKSVKIYSSKILKNKGQDKKTKIKKGKG